MTISKLLLMGFLVVIVVPMRATGQTFDLQFIPVTNDGSNYDVKVQIKSNPSTFGLGSSNLVFTYNTSALSSPSLLSAYNFNSGFYTLWVSEPLTGKVSINIYYGGGTGGGTTVLSTYMDVATVHFTTTDPSGSSTLQWWTGTPNRTVVYNDNQTYPNNPAEIPAGTLNNLNTTPLPIQLASSTASVVRDNDVEVTWKTVSETNNYGFEIYRKRGDAGEWAKIAFVQGHGTTLAAQSYTYLDKSVGFGKYFYQIKQIDLDGKSETYPEMNVVVGVAPGQFVLAQNYPNPFNPSTVIEFVVPQSGFATVKVYNVLGQEVATVFEGNAEAGKINTARFDASNLPSAVYFYRLRSAGKADTKRMLLLK